MKHWKWLAGFALAIAFLIGLSACGDDDDDSASEAETTTTTAAETTTTAAPETTTTTAAPETTTTTAAPETTTTTAAPAGTPEELCAALDKLEDSIDAIDGDSIEEIQTTYDAAKADFEAARTIAGDQYKAEFDAFAAALDEFEAALAGGNLLDMFGAVGELALAGEALDESIDCPSDGDADAAEEELDAELDEAEDELEAEIEEEFD